MTGFPPLRLTFQVREDWIFSHVLAERARTHGDRPFIEPLDGPALTYAEADRLVNRLAHGLRALGVARGDRVLVMLPNTVEFMLLWWAANRLGAIEVSVNTAYKGYFLEHLVNNSGGRVIVVAREFLDRLEESAAKLEHLETIIVYEPDRAASAVPRLERFRTLAFEELYGRSDDPPGVPLSHRDLCAIMYTSGTTGPSKGVMLPNAFCHLFADCTRNLTRLGEDDAYLVATPLYHANAPIMQVYPAMLAGGRAVICPRFSASEWLDQIRRSGATATNLLGVMMDFVFRQPPRPGDRDHRLRVVLGQPAPAAIVEDFKRRFGIARVLEYYGMTEIGLATMMPWDDVRPGSCGKAMSEWYELRIADPETDEELGHGEVGELLVRPKEMWAFNQGYWEMPDKTLEALRNVWYHTGDALRRDAEGYYYFVDRMRDVIRRRAENIASYDIERVLSEHPDVAECTAVGVDSGIAGGEDEIKACLVLREGRALVPEEFLAWCEARLPYFAVPRYLEVLAELPRTPNNKIQKYLLRRSGGAAAWDRVKAGYQLQEEVRKAEAKRQRRAGAAAQPSA
ncbi:MAG: AMP-binding protein [Candidatus Rokubacteria bacterium]|nr:AMP-binding protein [Candidatus Rokubacteria bacterium]